MSMVHRLNVAQGPLIGAAARRLASDRISDYEPVFRGVWHSERPRPRFGDEQWEIAGADVANRRSSWLIDFTTFTPEWSLTCRELLFFRINMAGWRDVITPYNAQQKEASFRAGTIRRYRDSLKFIADLATERAIGLPNTWELQQVEELQQAIIDSGAFHTGQVVRWMYVARDALTYGGLGWDPTRSSGTAAWGGETASSRTLSSRGVNPDVFYRTVGNALMYVEKAAPDIFAALMWRDKYIPEPINGRSIAWRTDPEAIRFKDFPDVTTARMARLHDAIQSAGGIPTATTTPLGNRDAKEGEPCLRTLCAIAQVNTARDKAGQRKFVADRIATGTPLVPGGLPIPVSHIQRPDGTTGPWRQPFCYQSIGVEAQTLQQAAKIVLMAFTGMRDSEMSGIPRTGWKTTWHGSDAIITPEIKTHHGDPMKWWATPVVLHACEILEQLTDPESEYLLLPFMRKKIISPADLKMAETRNWKALQDFVARMNTDKNLLGFHPIPAGWGTTSRRNRGNDSLPGIHPRAFRFTLASISNFVALGDVAFQKQAKHASINMSHSYAANGATTEWEKVVLNTIVNRDAVDRTAKAVDLYLGVWSGDHHLSGHAGRDLERTIKQLLDSLPIDAYNPDSDVNPLDQFQTQVLGIAELAAAIRGTAQILYPGTIVHCLKYAPKMECAEGETEPVQGLCAPETCHNVLMQPEQAEIMNHRRKQVTEWLNWPRIPKAQREVLQRRQKNLSAQLRTEAGRDGK